MRFLSRLLISLFLVMAFGASALGSTTPNKKYNNQTTGSNVNTWGVVLNSNFTTIDNNLGGTLSLSVAGNSNVTLTNAQAQNLIYNFTGALTGNINVIFPAAGGLYFINNNTTGAYTLTIQAGTSTAGITVPQGQSVPVVVDNSSSPPTIDGAVGTTITYIADSVGGTANAISVSLTSPPNFVLTTGAQLWFVPTTLNTSSTVTMTTPDSSTKNIKAISPGGLIDVPANYLVPGNPQLLYYDGTEWVDITTVYFGTIKSVSTDQSVTNITTFDDYVATAAVNLTIAHSTTLPPFWWIETNALGGAVTITPNASDAINVNGQTLSAGTAFVIPQGATAKVSSDGAGNLFILFNGARLNTESTLASATTTNLGSAASNIIDITGTTTITSFGSSASIANPLYFIRFTGVLTLTYNATSLIVPGSANITTAAGDAAIAEYLGSGNWKVLSYSHIGGNVVKVDTQQFTSSGTYTPCVGLIDADVRAVGGGGGGGGAKGAATTRGGGGGAGSYSEKVLSAASVGTSQTVTIGAAGAAGDNTGSNGGDGGATSLGTLVTTNGGAHGSGSTSGFAAPGAGGATGTGDFVIAGQAGMSGYFGGIGGYSPLGFGYSGQPPSSDNAAGLAGSGYGAGGSAGHDNTSTGWAGAPGLKGYMIITEYCSQ